MNGPRSSGGSPKSNEVTQETRGSKSATKVVSSPPTERPTRETTRSKTSVTRRSAIEESPEENPSKPVEDKSPEKGSTKSASKDTQLTKSPNEKKLKSPSKQSQVKSAKCSPMKSRKSKRKSSNTCTNVGSKPSLRRIGALPPIELFKTFLLPKKSPKRKRKRKGNFVRLELDKCSYQIYEDGSNTNIQAPDFSVISLNCPVKNYEWGKIGSNSYVGQILKDQGAVIDEDQPYAELWMGTHKSGSSCIRGLSPDLDGHPLTDLFGVFPEFIGDLDIYQKYGPQLPFLFKVLSVNKPLSIQVHPDKSLAGQLFSSRPEHFPDPNHKPEMAIALTPFSALAYFRPHDQIIGFARKYTQFGNLIGSDLLAEYEKEKGANRRECLKKCFITLLNKSPEIIVRSISELVDQAKSYPDDSILQIFKQIADHYPSDVGTFACFFLNHINLEPGQALFIDVNQPHCYLSGDCIEIMACSDNVIRAGLTPKFKDVQLLCETMKYKPKPIDQIILAPVCKNEFIHLYSPPVDEFAIEKIEIPEGSSSGLKYPLERLPSASLLIIIQCKSAVINSIALLKKSHIYFLPPELNYTLSDVCGRFLAFRAFIKR